MSDPTELLHDESHVDANAGVSISSCGHVRTIIYDAGAGDWVSGINYCQCAFCKGLRDKAPCNRFDCYEGAQVCAVCDPAAARPLHPGGKWTDWPASVGGENT
jgi:hypothetical protein